MSHKKIVTECYADKIMVEFLGFPVIEVHNGNGEVINNVVKNKNRIGLIDRDKGNFKGQFLEFELKENNQAESIEIFKHKTENLYIIRIAPAIEKWLWNEAERLEIRQIFRDYEGFRNFLKNRSIESDRIKKSKFKNYLNTIYQTNENKLKILKIVITNILE